MVFRIWIESSFKQEWGVSITTVTIYWRHYCFQISISIFPLCIWFLFFCLFAPPLPSSPAPTPIPLPLPFPFLCHLVLWVVTEWWKKNITNSRTFLWVWSARTLKNVWRVKGKKKGGGEGREKNKETNLYLLSQMLLQDHCIKKKIVHIHEFLLLNSFVLLKSMLICSIYRESS